MGREELEEAQDDRDRDVVGQVRDERRRRGPGSSVTCRASAWTTSRRSARAGALAATVSGRALRRARVDLDATTRRPAGSRARVSEPRPGPTSTTTSSWVTDTRDPHDALDRVAVDDEVLAPLLGRSHPEPVGELADRDAPSRSRRCRSCSAPYDGRSTPYRSVSGGRDGVSRLRPAGRRTSTGMQRCRS
jgi:hypothetical protein